MRPPWVREHLDDARFLEGSEAVPDVDQQGPDEAFEHRVSDGFAGPVPSTLEHGLAGMELHEWLQRILEKLLSDPGFDAEMQDTPLAPSTRLRFDPHLSDGGPFDPRAGHLCEPFELAALQPAGCRPFAVGSLRGL